jgi:hypothetical protein
MPHIRQTSSLDPILYVCNMSMYHKNVQCQKVGSEHSRSYCGVCCLIKWLHIPATRQLIYWKLCNLCFQFYVYNLKYHINCSFPKSHNFSLSRFQNYHMASLLFFRPSSICHVGCISHISFKSWCVKRQIMDIQELIVGAYNLIK